MKDAQPIRIFVDAHVFDGEYQGTRTFIKELYTALLKKNNVTIYLAACDIDNLKNIFPASTNIHFIQYNAKTSWPRLLINIPSLLRKHDLDFAHFQYMIPPVKNNKCKYVVTIHDVIFEEFPNDFTRYYRFSKRLLYQLAASNADIVTTVSEYSKNSIEKFLGVKPGKTTVIPNAVSSIFFQPYDKELSVQILKKKYGIEKFILYVSRFEPRKNHAALLKAYLDLELYSKGYHLVLLGHQRIEVYEFDKLLEALPADIRQFIFISHEIDDDELLEFYRAASLFVYPSKAEGFGISPLEAGALKIPVICSNASAMKEFIFFGDLHIDTNDHALLKKKITTVLFNPLNELKLQTISDTIRENYSWQASAEKFYDLLLQQRTISSGNKIKINDQLSVS